MEVLLTIAMTILGFIGFVITILAYYNVIQYPFTKKTLPNKTLPQSTGKACLMASIYTVLVYSNTEKALWASLVIIAIVDLAFHLQRSARKKDGNAIQENTVS